MRVILEFSPSEMILPNKKYLNAIYKTESPSKNGKGLVEIGRGLKPSSIDHPLVLQLTHTLPHFMVSLSVILSLTVCQIVELFQILKNDAVKLLHSICQQLENQQWPQDRKRSVFIPIPKKGNAKECSNYRTIVPISHTSKVMLKILQARLQQYVNHELPDVQAGFRKDRGTRDQIANIRWIIEKARELKKTSTSALLTMPKTLTVWITINCGKF